METDPGVNRHVAPDARPERCAWCDESLGGTSEGPIRCPHCGVSMVRRGATDRTGGAVRTLPRTAARMLARRFDRIAPRGPVLEVGTSDASLLHALRAQGRAVTRLGHGEGSASQGEENLEGGCGGWAAIVFRNSLERLTEPGAALVQASRMLDAGGVLVVAIGAGAEGGRRPSAGARAASDAGPRLVEVPAKALVDALDGLDLAVDRVGPPSTRELVSAWVRGVVSAARARPSLGEAVMLAATRPWGSGLYVEAHRP